MIASSREEESIFIKLDCAILQSEKKIDCCTKDSLTKGHLIEIFKKIALQNKTVKILLNRIDQSDIEIQNDILFLLENQFNRISNGSDLKPCFIATSETDLKQLVKSNRFRKDLFYRLNVIPIHLPSLRKRMKDIPLLADYFSISACAEMNRSYVFPQPGIIEKLRSYNWPGNIDELERILKQFVTKGDEKLFFKQTEISERKTGPTKLFYQTMQAEAEPDVMEIKDCMRVLGDLPLKRICDKFAYRTEKKLMQKALETTNWNRKKAAALLNISYKSMLNKMKIYEIV